MLIALIIVEIVLCITVLAMVPLYGFTLGFLAGAAAFYVAFMAVNSTDSSDKTWTTVLLIFGLYIIGGAWRIVVKRRKQAEEDAVLKVRQDRSAAYALGRFVTGSRSVRDEVRRIKALASGELNELGVGDFVYAEAVGVVRRIALAKDRISFADADHIRLLCDGAGLRVLSSAPTFEVAKLIENAQTADLTLIPLLVEAGSDDAKVLRDHFIAFALEIGVGEQRSVALAEELQMMRELAQSREELLQEAANVIEDSKNFLEEILRVGDSRYSILGVSESCTEDELKNAYRSKVSQWHPDQMQKLAPEIQTMATEQMTQINEAFNSIVEERRGPA